MVKINTHAITTLWRTSTTLSLCLLMLIATVTLNVPRAQAFAVSDEQYPAGGQGGQQDMRVVRADGDNRPAIIFVHGGGWRVDDGNFGPDFQDRAAQRGYTSFRISYKLMPNGIDEQYDEVTNAIKYVRDNAAKYNIDPNRIAIWGDSAGGSLVVRAAASGKSGAAVAVGWSAPTNAFRDIFNSFQSFMIGLDHTKCVNTDFTSIITDIVPLFDGQRGAIDKLLKGQLPTPDESIALAVTSLKAANMAADKLPSTFDKLKESANEWGIEINISKGGSSSSSDGSQTGGTEVTPPNTPNDESTTNGGTTDTTDNNTTGNGTTDSGNTGTTPKPEQPFTEEQLKDQLHNVTPEQRVEMGNAAYYLAQTSANPDLTNEQRQVVNTLQMGMNDVISAQASNVQDRENQLALHTDLSSDDIAKIAKDSGTTVDRITSLAKENGVSTNDMARAIRHYESIDDFLAAATRNNVSVKDLVAAVTANEDTLRQTITNGSQGSTDTGSNSNSSTGDANILTGSFGTSITGSVNIQGEMLTKKLIQCLDEFIKMSPAMFASPRTPPMFLASAQAEYLVNPADTIQMSEKLKSMGIRSESLILPGDNHMGYDVRAENPSFDFIGSILHP